MLSKHTRDTFNMLFHIDLWVFNWTYLTMHIMFARGMHYWRILLWQEQPWCRVAWFDTLPWNMFLNLISFCLTMVTTHVVTKIATKYKETESLHSIFQKSPFGRTKLTSSVVPIELTGVHQHHWHSPRIYLGFWKSPVSRIQVLDTGILMQKIGTSGKCKCICYGIQRDTVSIRQNGRVTFVCGEILSELIRVWKLFLRHLFTIIWYRLVANKGGSQIIAQHFSIFIYMGQ